MDPNVFLDIDPAHKRGKRHYVATKNNYTAEDIDKLHAWAHDECSFLVYGKEIGKQGTPHLQIYMEFQNTKSMSVINKKLFPLWLGFRRGTPLQAAGYCRKGESTDTNYAQFADNPHETWDGEMFGILSHQGKRTDLDDPVEMIVEDKRPMREVARTYPREFVKYHKGFTALRSHLLEPRSLKGPPEVIWLWGGTGLGKTRDAYIKYFPDEPHYVWKPSNGNWWDGYDGEMKIILDEFRGTMPWADILGLLDRNEYRAPIKGGFVQIQADKFIITSPFQPCMCYRDKDDGADHFRQLQRRITQVVQYTQFGTR